MSEVSKAYEPQLVEQKWYDFWLQAGSFTADPASPKPAYSIVIPPPNVTGVLHLGHVLNNTIQDILARKARMEGKEVLWLPGTDHAGIGTQTVVEKALRKEGLMKHRDDLGREKFLEYAWAWKEKYGGIIIQQLKKLGCSCDWTRQRFTMDPAYSRCVQKVFLDLYAEGLIYRGKRIVNWDPAARTALSDEEVEMVEEKGHLWHLKYPLTDDQGKPQGGEFLVVATTRPETMLGDEAVAVNPKDPRYTHLVGRRCWLPLQNKPLPIIADDFVDPKFGTGCVKVTPAHDPNDYQMGLRHYLPVTVVIGPNGAMTQTAGKEFEGMDRMEAREAVIERLAEQDLLLKVEDYVHNVGYSQRTGAPIEPYLSEQWFLKYPNIEQARACVELPAPEVAPPDKTGPDGASALSRPTQVPQPGMRFHPERWAKVYHHWLSRIQDWCISRQLWWGHRIPVWYKKQSGSDGKNPQEALPLAEKLASRPASDPPVRVADSLDDVNPKEELIRAQAECPGPGWEQDPDVLDTWFSSWLWPFATMGWPEQTDTLKKFYPTADLVTGPDIIFFWVARMIMAGWRFMGDLPFRNVYFTGIIRDKQGRKMSKSLGNSPDPLDLIDKYGADALRFGTMRSAPLGQDVLFDEKDVELGRNFCNKLWNACRFRQMQGGVVQAEIEPSLLNGYDKWILLKLDQALVEIAKAFEEYRFNEVTHTLYRFFWNEYCDWYVEASKASLSRPIDPSQGGGSIEADKRRANTLAVLDFVLSHTLRLFHPFLPFITEELWHGMGYNADMPESQGGQTIMFAPWPKPLGWDFRGHYGLDDCYLEIIDAKFAVVTQGRALRREGNIPAGKKVKYVLKPAGAVPPHDIEVLKLLLNAEALELDPHYVPPKGTPSVASEMGELYLPLEGLVDVAAEKARLTKEIEKTEAEIAKAQERLANRAFTQKAPASVLAEHQRRLAEWRSKKDRLLDLLRALEG